MRSPTHQPTPFPTLQVIARSLPTNEIQGIREMFKAIDEDGSGCITVNELREGLRKKGAELAFAEVCLNVHGRGGQMPESV